MSDSNKLTKKELAEIKRQEKLQKEYRNIFQEILQNVDTTDKQAMAIASIILADKIVSKNIFDDESLKIEDIVNWFTSAKEVDIATRAYEWTLDWISQNTNKFKEDSLTEVWGKIIDDDDGRRYAFINKKVFLSELDKAGYDFDAIKDKLDKKGQLIKGSSQKYTIATRINGNIIRCVKISLDIEEEEKTNYKQQELPF